MSALDEKTRAERALKDLKKVQGEQQVRFGVWLASSSIIFFCDIFEFAFHLNAFIFQLFVCVLFYCIWTFAVIWFYLLTWTSNGTYPADLSVAFVCHCV